VFTTENILKINFMIYPDIKYYSGKQTNARKMVKAYGTYGGWGERCVRVSV
jgi:hypothetical protein